MDLLFGLAVIVMLVLLLAAARLLNPVTGSLLVIMTGVVLGHPFWNTSLGPLPITLDRLLWGILILAVLFLVWTRRIQLQPVNRTDILVVLLGLVLMVSTLVCDWRYKENLPLSRLLFFNLMPMGFYFVARHCRLEHRHVLTTCGLLTVFGFFLAITGIAEHQEWSALVFPKYILNPEYFEFLGRARGPFLNPVSLGLYLTTCLVAAAALWPYCHPLLRCGLALVIVTILVASFLTFTRSVWLGSALAVALICWMPAPRPLRGAMLVTATIAVLAGSLLFADKLNNFQRDKYVTAAEMAESVSLRPMLAHVAWKMFLDRPVLGHGFGQYTAAKKPYHYVETANMPLRKVLPYMQHNLFLSYLTETGLVGMGLLILLLGTAIVKGWRLWQSSAAPAAERYFGLLVLAFVGSYCLNGMFHDVSIIAHTAALWYLLLGMVESLSGRRQPMTASRHHPDEPDSRHDGQLRLVA